MGKGWMGLAGLLCVSAGLASAGTITGPVHNPSTGNYYYLLEADTWSNSQAYAQSLGGHLVTVRNSDHNAWLLSTFGTFGGVNRNLWIGLHDPVGNGQFSWVSGLSSSFTSWAPGEPNYLGGERYTMILSPSISSAGYWNNHYDTASSGYTGLGGTFAALPNCGIVEVCSLPTVVPFPPALLGGIGLLMIQALSRCRH